MPIGDFIKTQGVSFLVARNKETVSTEKGLPNCDKCGGKMLSLSSQRSI